MTRNSGRQRPNRSDTLKRHWTITNEKHPDLVCQGKDGPVLILQLKNKTPFCGEADSVASEHVARQTTTRAG
jgi:hypothetical protein